MKNLLSIVLVSAVFTFFFWYLGLRGGADVNYISPVPDFLNIQKNKQATFLDLWLPFVAKTYGDNGDLTGLTAKAVLVYNLSTEEAVFEKSAKEVMPMASLTKIMTAIIALENETTDSYLVEEADLVGENSMGLEAGEVLSKEELLYGLMLPSGNDAAEVLANNYIDGGREGFIKAMNDKARALGLATTRFSNPSGLQGDGEQYTTAYDLLVITRYALANYPLFEKIVSTANFDIAETDGHKFYSLVNQTNLLTTYPGVKGVKTGYTPEAGLCLVTYLDYEGHKMIAIILNSENRRREMKELLDYALNSVGVVPPEYTGE
jgi:D-alanyl-D-alanine carboxypeptidase